MKQKLKTKTNSVIIVAVFSLLILGCQPESGELLPVNNSGMEIASSRFESDTAVINDDGLKLKVFGSWDGRAKVRVFLENNSGNDIKLNFDKSTVVDSRGGEINIDSIYEDQGSAVNEIKDNQFSVGNGEKKKLVIGFPLNLSNSLADKPPRIISLILAVENNSKNKETRKHRINFEGISKRADSNTIEPQI